MQQHPVRQPGQRVVQRAVPVSVRRVASGLACLSVEQVRGRDVGQCSICVHRLGIQRSRRLPVQIERPRPLVTGTKPEREHRRKPSHEHELSSATAEPFVSRQVNHHDRFTLFERRHARSLNRPASATARDATLNHGVYGFFGASVFAETADLAWTDFAETRLSKSPWIVLFTAADLIDAGLELWDTGMAPQYDVVHADLSELVARMVGTARRVLANPHHDPGGER